MWHVVGKQWCGTTLAASVQTAAFLDSQPPRVVTERLYRRRSVSHGGVKIVFRVEIAHNNLNVCNMKSAGTQSADIHASSKRLFGDDRVHPRRILRRVEYVNGQARVVWYGIISHVQSLRWRVQRQIAWFHHTSVASSVCFTCATVQHSRRITRARRTLVTCKRVVNVHAPSVLFATRQSCSRFIASTQ